jgi:hypothetical protein
MTIYVVIKVAKSSNGDIYVQTENSFTSMEAATEYTQVNPIVGRELINGEECTVLRAIHSSEINQ